MTHRLYVSTEHGLAVAKSADGRSWELESHQLKEWSVREVAVAPSAPNRLFAGTRGDGVLLSEDFGRSFKKPCYGKRGPGKVHCITVDPRDPNTLYAGTEPIDLFVSHDGGKSWECLDSVRAVSWVGTVTYPVPTVEPHIRDIAIDPKDSRTLYVALQVGYMLKSTDGGKSWKLLNRGLDADVHTIVIDPANTDNIYIATGGHDCRQGRINGRALYLSRDGGENWSPTGLNFTQEYSIPLTMHPKDSRVLYAGLAHGQPRQWERPTGAESVMIKTRNGGESWEKIDGSLAEMNRSFPEAIVLDEAQPERMYAGLRNGEIYGSADGGSSWRNLGVKAPEICAMVAVQS